MKRIVMTLVFLSLLHGTAGGAEPVKVEQDEQERWVRHVIPLPHQITIGEKVSAPRAGIYVRVREGATPAELRAAEELRSLIEKGAPEGERNAAFVIRLGIVDNRGELDGTPVNGADMLHALPNNNQAYIIKPEGTRGLTLASLGEPGIYYAAMTLKQLLEHGMSADTAVIPLVNVLDWPDMEERGLWNFPDPDVWLPWMAGMKLNYGKMVATNLVTIERGKPNRAIIDRDRMIEARAMGFNYLPFIMHLNFLHDYGLFRAYPEVAGVGDGALAGRYFAHKHGNQHRAPCADNPILTRILTEWMRDIASQGANEVSCWLTERPAQCGHIRCREIGQFVLEARAFVNAWRETRKEYPDFIIRLFISTTTDERYFQLLAETPKEVRLERCCSADLERVRRQPRDLFVNSLFDSYASEGWWVANYDVPIGAYGRVETPEFKIPSSSAHRIRDFVVQLADRHYKGAYGMLAWGNLGREICGFNIAALAEWSWNKEGRSTREFAAAWAAKQGLGDPDAFAEWSEIIGPVEFDVYESEFPTCYSWGKATAAVDGRAVPVPGEGMFRYYESREDFDRKISACERALAIAKKLDSPHPANETRVVASYAALAKAVFNVMEFVSSGDMTTSTGQAELVMVCGELEKAGAANAEAIRAWRTAFGPEPWHYRVTDAIKATETTVADIIDIVRGKYLY